MAQIRFEDIQDVGQNNSNQNFSVGFFSLKNDGDEAIVRIMHDSTDSFDIVSTHAINVGGKYRRVNCCRTPREPVESCPLCASGNPSQQRFYIHLIQYTRNENGQVVPEAKVWERSLAYANTIKNLIVEYGPLSNLIFKIKRSGAAGSMDTKYTIMYANPQMYPENIYPPVPNAFDGYTAIGNVVMDKTVKDIIYFVTNGSFPEVQNDAPKQNAPVVNQSAGNFIPQYPPVNPMNTAYVPANPTAAPMPGSHVEIPTATPVMQRPQRYY